LAFRKIFPVTDITEGEFKLFHLSGVQGVLTMQKGKHFAFENSCPHKGATLSSGQICFNEVTCPLHGWTFNLTTGENNVDPDKTLLVFQTKVENDFIWVMEPEF